MGTAPRLTIAARRPTTATMVIAALALLLLATVPLLGGRLRALGAVPLRRPWLPAASLTVQVLIITVMPGALPGVHAPLHVATYGLLAAFVWSNRRLPGMGLIATGAAANVLAITVNGGVMPASASALSSAGMPHRLAGEYANSAVVERPRLPWLGDVFAIPADWPMTNVFSAGDVLIVLGFAVGVHVLSASRLGVGWRGLAAAVAPSR